MGASFYRWSGAFHILSLLLTIIATLTSAAQITFSVPPTLMLPNPSTLPASTRATLFKHSTNLVVPLTRRNTFEFQNVSAGSYLFTVQARDHTFGPLRVDVLAGDDARGEKVEAYQTFWGNEWRNKGEYRGGGVAEAGAGEAKVSVDVRPEGIKDFYADRPGFDPVSFLKSPMIMMALFSLVLIVGVPYLTEGMDEETKAEFEQLQQKSPLSKATNASQNGLQNFDLASWMAGKTSGGGGEKSS